MKKTAGIANVGAEELEQFKATVMTRDDTRAQTDELFNNAKKSREADKAYVQKRFIQAPASSGSPRLAKEAAANTIAFFEEVSKTEAQRRFPELMKVAAGQAGFVPRPVTPTKPRVTGEADKGAVAVRPSLSGGNS